MQIKPNDSWLNITDYTFDYNPPVDRGDDADL